MDPRPLLHRAVALGAILVAAFATAPAAHAAPEHRVAVVDDAYDDGDEQPSTTEVVVGDTVTWQWSDANEHAHTVSSVDGAFDSDADCSGVLDDCGAAQRPPFSVTFDEPGTYRYVCKLHRVTMSGTIEVAAADEPSDGNENEDAPLDQADEPSETSSPEQSGPSDDGASGTSPEGEGSRDADGAKERRGDSSTTGRSREGRDTSGAENREDPENGDTEVTGASRTRSSIGQASLPSLQSATRWQQPAGAASDPGVLVAPPATESPAQVAGSAAVRGAFPAAPELDADDVTIDTSAIGEPGRGLTAVPVGLAILLLLASGAALTKYVLLGPNWATTSQ